MVFDIVKCIVNLLFRKFKRFSQVSKFDVRCEHVIFALKHTYYLYFSISRRYIAMFIYDEFFHSYKKCDNLKFTIFQRFDCGKFM